jgi:recombinational DNA repair protein RecT
MDREHIEAVRARSQSWRAFQRDGKESPWRTDAEEMWRKSPIRRLAKRMPLDTTDKREILLKAVMLDEYAEKRNLLVPTEDGWTVNPDYKSEEAEPLEPTIEAPDLTGVLEESIEDVEKRKAAVAAKNKPIKSRRKIQPNVADNQVPKAAIPPESKIDDPVLTVKQQTDIFHTAFQRGWKVPEEVNKMLEKHFGVNSIQKVRNSQYGAVMQKIDAGTQKVT